MRCPTQLRSLQTTPGRLEQSVEAASYDAWIKYYRADENTPNTAISYYVKGAVIGFLLDANIRRLTDGAKSLDDVMRLMYARFSGEKGFSREDVRAAVAEVVGPAHARDIRAWMARALETTAELDYADALAWFGLRMTPPPAAPRAYLGVATRTENGKTIVAGIRRGSPAASAGMSLLDEIAAINGEPLAAGQLTQRLERIVARIEGDVGDHAARRTAQHGHHARDRSRTRLAIECIAWGDARAVAASGRLACAVAALRSGSTVYRHP